MHDATRDESLVATVQHAIRLGEQIDRLTRLRRESLAVAAGMAADASLAAIREAIDLAREAQLPGRRFLLEAQEKALAREQATVKVRGSARRWPTKTGPCVYLLYDSGSGGDLIYVGYTINLRSRMASHSAKPWERVEWILCETPEEARELEATLIFQHQPRDNRRGKTVRLRVA